jgi:hypothetical protein
MMNRNQRVVLLFGLLVISAIVLGRDNSNSIEATAYVSGATR